MGRAKVHFTCDEDQNATLEELSQGWPKKVSAHPLHPQHPLLKSLRPSYTCATCHGPGADWSLSCAACELDLHPDCALEAQLSDAAKHLPATIDQHALHSPGHPLVKTRRDAFWCGSCGERGNWWCFQCEECDLALHLLCAVAPRDYAQMPGMARTMKVPYWCSRCAEEGNGLCYSWEDLKVDLHPRCAEEGGEGKWPESVKHELHPEHDLVKTESDGHYCCKRCWASGSGWLFACADCAFRLHPRCAVGSPAPEGGWVDGLMHEQQHQKLLQTIQMQQSDEENKE